MHFFLRSNMPCFLCVMSLVLYVNARVLNVTETGSLTLIISPTILSIGKPILAPGDGLLSSTGNKSKVRALNGTEETVKDELNELLTRIPDSHFDYLRELTFLNETENEISRVKREEKAKSLADVKAELINDLTGKDLKMKELNERLLGYPIPKNVPPQVPPQTSSLLKVNQPSSNDDKSMSFVKRDSLAADSGSKMGTASIIRTTGVTLHGIKNATQELVGETVLEHSTPALPDNVPNLIKTSDTSLNDSEVESSTRQLDDSTDSTSEDVKIKTKPIEASSMSILKDLPTSTSIATENVSLKESSTQTDATIVENSSDKSEKVTATELESKLSPVYSTPISVNIKPASSLSDDDKDSAVHNVSNKELRASENASLKLSSSPSLSSVLATKEQQSSTKIVTITNEIKENAVKSVILPTTEKMFVNATTHFDQEKTTNFKQVVNGNVSKNENVSAIQSALSDVTNSSNFDIFDEIMGQLSLMESEAMGKIQDLQLTLLNLTNDDRLLNTDHNKSKSNDESLTDFMEYYLTIGGESNKNHSDIIILTADEFAIPSNVTQFISDVVLNKEVENNNLPAIATESYHSGTENVIQKINASTIEGSVSNRTQPNAFTVTSTYVTEMQTENPTIDSSTKKRSSVRRKRKHHKISRPKQGSSGPHPAGEKNRLNNVGNYQVGKHSEQDLKPDNTTTELGLFENVTGNTKLNKLPKEALRNKREKSSKLEKDNSTLAFLIDAGDLTLNVKVKIEKKNSSETDGKSSLRLSSLDLGTSNASEVISEGQAGNVQQVNLTKKTSEGEALHARDYADSKKQQWHYGSDHRSPLYDLLVSEASREHPGYIDEDNVSWPEHSGDNGASPEHPRKELKPREMLAPQSAPKVMAVKEGSKEVAQKVTNEVGDKEAVVREKNKKDSGFLFVPNMVLDSETPDKINTLNLLIDRLLVDDEDNYSKTEHLREAEIVGKQAEDDNNNNNEDDMDDPAQLPTEDRGPPLEEVIAPSSGYLLSVTLPAFLGMLVMVIFCCVCLHTKCFCCKLFEERKVPTPQPPTADGMRRQRKQPTTSARGHSI